MVAQVLDKMQDTLAILKLIDQLQKAILIYQVCVKVCQIQVGLTQMMTDVPTTINPQPGHTVDGKFLCIVLALS